MTDEVLYQYEDLWYIQTRGDGDKRPKDEWGGYSQSFEDADKVYTHDDVEKFPSESWAICGVQDKPHLTRALLVFDLDVHKAADKDDSPERVQVDSRTPIIKSQNGGFHIPFFVHCDKNALSDSDFELARYLSWDVDIKGSAVGGHVVAPGDIPGISGNYEIVQDETIPTVTDPRDACARITLDGEPLLEYNPDTFIGGGNWDIDRNADPPEDMPTCYHRGLQVRAENPDDHDNTHMVNTYTAMCGLAAGYSIDEMVGHFCDEYAPGQNADREKTRYHIEHMAKKMDRGDLAPPAISSLRDYEILDDTETCSCDIEYHGTGKGASLPDSSSGTTTTDARTGPAWDYVRERYENDGEGPGRKAAADVLEQDHDWMYVMEEDRLWVYNGDTGCFNPWGKQSVAKLTEAKLGDYWGKTEASEITARLEARNQTRREELNGQSKDGMYLCVGNGVVDLESGELHDHDPSYKFTRGLQWDYDRDTANPEPILEFLDDITERPADRDTLLDHLAHGLMPGHPYRAFVITYGPGSNGKTQMGELFREFVGKENAASVELQDLTGDDQFATGALPGSYVNIGDDVSVGQISDLSVLKSLTGGGEMRANEKFEKKYDFKNEAAMFFSANEPPRIGEETEAIGDRLYPIKMPYRFVDNPTTEREKPKTPGIASQLTNDDEAMRGLLMLAIDHAQELIESNGQYSLPEGPKERRAKYEAASDPIKRFIVDCVEPGSHSDVVLKDDAYTVYTELCGRDDERATNEDNFKDQISKQTLIDAEPSTTRKLTHGDDQPTCWRYMEFTSEAKSLMPDRLESRYFGDGDTQETADTDETENPDDTAFGATPLTDAAQSLTGYVTVTAEAATVTTPDHENAPTRAVLTDESGAMDMVTWDDSMRAYLENAEGDTIAVENVEVTEHDGKRQLQPVENVTQFTSIQQGVGHTEGESPDENQGQIPAATDGGEIEGATATVTEHVRTECASGDTLTAAKVAGVLDLSPQQAKTALETITTKRRLLEATDDGWRVL